MTLTQNSFADFSDDSLLAEAKRLASVERSATATLIESLMEIDGRRLYLREGCSSLFTYCTQVLRLAEGAAYNRIEAARAARRFPVILEMLREAALTLATVRLLAPHLTEVNHVDVLASAHHRSKREVEWLVAALKPKPAVAPTIRRLPNAPQSISSPAPARATATSIAPPISHCVTCDSQSIAAVNPVLRTQDVRPAVIAPLAPERFKIQCTISLETHDKLRRAQDLLRHTIPSADLGEILDRAITLLVDDLERRRCAATTRPRASRQGNGRSRHIPAAVRRAVWKRDEGRCAFASTEGRCRETAFLEFHHVEPYALGGTATVETIQLRCRAHNQYEASLVFGVDVVRESYLSWLMMTER